MIRALNLTEGFAWWLPLLTAALAALIAGLLAASTASAWDADVHLWVKDDRPASEYAALILEQSVHDSASSSMMASEEGLPRYDNASVEITDTLIKLTVRSSRQSDAEALAQSIAYEARNASIVRFGPEAELDVLGLVQPGARKVSPNTEWIAAWASALGLGGGLAIAWATATRARGQRSMLGRLGRRGLKPLAVISAEAEAAAERPTQSSGAVGAFQAASAHTDVAVLLANAINPIEGVVAVTPLDEESGVAAILFQTARTLASRGRAVIWLDSRRPAFELTHDAPPQHLLGAPWTTVERSELITRNARRSLRPNGVVLLLTDPLSDPATVNVAESAAGTILILRTDVSDEALSKAQMQLSRARLLGVAVTHALPTDLHEFELAQMTES